jgi:O-antigen/teichoic acid export membrane protein
MTEETNIETESSQKSQDLWDEVGFHKPMASFWYNLVLNIINLGLGIVLSGVLLNYFYPFPESVGYKSAAMGIFILFFRIFDLGTHMTMDRYIAESRITDVNKMVGYIQYFIWYQMITGLIQTTAVSMYALFLVPETELSYGVWLMLIAASTQYPGFLGVFSGVLNSLQHYDKSAMIGFIQGEVFQRLTEMGFVLLGKWYGETHPEIGIIMGIAIGSAIGTYVDDFLGTVVAAVFFTKVMKNEGITVRDCFGHNFTWDLVKDPLIFGLKTGLPGLLSGITGLIILWEYILFLPQYTTFSTLVGMAGTFIWIIASVNVNLTPLYSEAYLNGKKKLTQYYIGQGFRYSAINLGFFLSIFLIVYISIEDIMIELGIVFYLLMIPFILPLIFRSSLNPIIGQADQLIVGANKPNFLFKVRILEEILKVLVMTAWLVWLKLPEKYGLIAIIWILTCGDLFAILIKTVICYIYINRNIIKIKIPWWQCVVAPTFATLITLGFNYLGKFLIFDALRNQFGLIVALIPTVVLFIVSAMFIYFPGTAILGGWDEGNIESFKKVVKMCGPSTFLVKPMFKLVLFATRISPLHNKFPVDNQEAEKEALELLELKRAGIFTLK